MNAPARTYNGWSNYETWAVKLWMDNEEGTYNFWKEQTKEAVDEAKELEESGTLEKYFTVDEKAALMLADNLKEQHEEFKPELNGVYADLLSAAMSEVDWHEIATSLVSDYRENES